MIADIPPRRRAAHPRWIPLCLAALLGGCGAEEDAPTADRIGADTTRVLARITAPAENGAVHLVRVVARGDRYAFEPAEVHVRPGDVVRFVQTGAQPETIVFETAPAPPGGADFLRSRNLVRGPLLIRPGQVYEASFRGAPPGRYPFRSLPHGELGMRGVVVVE